MLAVDWHEVAIASAFVLGAIAGTVATIKLTRIIAAERRRRQNGG